MCKNTVQLFQSLGGDAPLCVQCVVEKVVLVVHDRQQLLSALLSTTASTVS